MAPARADSTGGHTGPAPWTAGGPRQKWETNSETKAQPPERPAAEVAGDQSRGMKLADSVQR